MREDLLPGEFGCRGCDRVFRSLAQFDRHQNVNYSRAPAVRCRDPLRLGLVQDARGTWCTPEGLKQAEIQRARLARARSARGAQRQRCVYCGRAEYEPGYGCHNCGTATVEDVAGYTNRDHR